MLKSLVKKLVLVLIGSRVNLVRSATGFILLKRFTDEHSGSSKELPDKHALYDFINNHVKSKQNIVYLEFGVFQGASIRYFSEINASPDTRFYGFDSFEGLPEDWRLTGGSVVAKGSFDVSGNIPKIDDSRVHFVKGIFQNTLIPFLEEHANILRDSPKIVHLDADLYSSELFCLSQVYRCLRNGDVVFFDDFFVAEHDFRALMDWSKSHLIDLKMIAHMPGFGKAAFEIVKKTTY
jgi:O-methyltransferase